MAPEFPFLAAGAIAVVGGYRREGQFPKDGMRAVLATVALVIVASATNGSRFAPLVRAFGFLVLLGSVYATVRTYQSKSKSKSKEK